MPSKLEARNYFVKLKKTVGEKMVNTPGVSKSRLSELQKWPAERAKIDRRANKYKRSIK